MSVFGGHVDISVANDDGEYDEQLDRERIDQLRVENLRFKCFYIVYMYCILYIYFLLI